MPTLMHRVIRQRRTRRARTAVFIGPRPGGESSPPLPPETPRSDRVRRITAVIAAVTAILYLVWRLGFTLNLEQPIPSIVLLLADGLGAIATLGFALSLWKLTPPRRPGPPPQGLSVDVWIPTYNEDLSILRRTIYHCVAMDYPHTTWVLDDGHRPEVRALAESLGARYLSRPDNKHGKAGNLNYAYAHTTGDVIASFDADFVPQKDFLTRLLGYFNDPKTALVQVPQRYYNPDSFQHRLGRIHGGLWSEQGTFFDLIMTGRNRWNAAYWIGTNAILRRSAVEAVGGFSTDSIVEDMLTGLRLHAGGWRSVYVNEALAFGLAPAYLSQFLVQRLRWAQGAAQVLRRQNPLFTRGLSLAQRICYLSSVLHFFEGFAKLVYYFTPALFFLLGVTPIAASGPVVAVIMTYVAIQVVASQIISGGQVRIVRDELFSMIRYFTYFLGNLALFTRRPLRFRVTPKGDDAAVTLMQFIGPMLVLAVNLAALVIGVVTLVKQPDGAASALQIAGLVWCGYFTLIAIGALHACLSLPATVGFAIHDFVALDVETQGGLATTREGCVTKAWGDERVVFWSRLPYPIGAPLTLRLHVRGQQIPLTAKVSRSRALVNDGTERVFEHEAMLTDAIPEAVRLQLVDKAFSVAMLRQEHRFTSASSVNFFPLLVDGDKLGVGMLDGPRRLTLQFAGPAPASDRFTVVLPGESKVECVVAERMELDGDTFLVGNLDATAHLPSAYDLAPLGRPRRVAHFDGVVAATTVIATAAITWMAVPPTFEDARASGLPTMAAPLPALGAPLAPPVTPLAPTRVAQQIEGILHGAWSRTLTNRVVAAVPAAEGAGLVAPEPLIGGRGEAYAFFDSEDLDRDGKDGVDWSRPDWKRGADPFEYVVVSESQSYRMWQAVLIRDRETFKALWRFARTELQHANLRGVATSGEGRSGDAGRPELASPESLGLVRDHLFAWRWHPSVALDAQGAAVDGVLAAPGDGARDGWMSATDADADIALALVWASRAFATDPDARGWREEARAIAADLWERASFEVDGERYLAAWPGGRCVAPGYLSPASYRVFAAVDPEHDWAAVVRSSYALIARLPALAGPAVATRAAGEPLPNLPPSFVAPASGGRVGLCADKPDPSVAGSDALRLLFRVALDAEISGAPEARRYLAAGSDTGPHDFLRTWLDGRRHLAIDGYDITGKIPSAFELDGRPRTGDTTYGGATDGAYRANAGHYGMYLAYFSAGGDDEATARILLPLLTAEADPTPTVGYATGHAFQAARGDDGWLHIDATGTHWTVYDHSDWEATYNYFGNTWTWLGLALHSGLFRELGALEAGAAN